MSNVTILLILILAAVVLHPSLLGLIILGLLLYYMFGNGK